jgi:hypothetical protein
MKSKSYFTLREWVIIVSLALVSALINTYIPIKSITEHLAIPGPAAGVALLGGVIFVLWISLAHQITGKRYSGIVTSVIIASICLFIHPWYGVVEPFWFSLYGILGLGFMGAVIELMSRSYWRGVVSGGLGNLCCLVITWLAIGFHTGTWVSKEWAPFFVLGAIISGGIGALIAQEISRTIMKATQFS